MQKHQQLCNYYSCFQWIARLFNEVRTLAEIWKMDFTLLPSEYFEEPLFWKTRGSVAMRKEMRRGHHRRLFSGLNESPGMHLIVTVLVHIFLYLGMNYSSGVIYGIPREMWSKGEKQKQHPLSLLSLTVPNCIQI